MNIRMFSAVVLTIVSTSCFAANKLQVKNNTDVIIRAAAGSRATPPYKVRPFDAKSSLRIKPGQTGNLYVVENEEHPQVMVWQDNNMQGYTYELNAKYGKGLQVQVTNKNDRLDLLSVPFTYNTITQENIEQKGVMNVGTIR